MAHSTTNRYAAVHTRYAPRPPISSTVPTARVSPRSTSHSPMVGIMTYSGMAFSDTHICARIAAHVGMPGRVPVRGSRGKERSTKTT
jgi:hypothetical protein